MNPIHWKRLYRLFMGLLFCSGFCCLLMLTLKQEMNAFCTPSQALEQKLHLKKLKRFHIGGWVEIFSVRRDATLVFFTLKDDLGARIRVRYEGILPDLFKEGKEAIVYGYFSPETHMFLAQEVLAKHDDRYTPHRSET